MTITESEILSVNGNLTQIAQACVEIAKPTNTAQGRDPAVVMVEIAEAFSINARHILQATKAIYALMHDIAERGGVQFP